MAGFLISYDLNNKGKDYPNLIQDLRDYGCKRRLQSAWYLLDEEGKDTADTLHARFSKHLDEDDRLIVVQIGGYAGSVTELGL